MAEAEILTPTARPTFYRVRCLEPACWMRVGVRLPETIADLAVRNHVDGLGHDVYVEKETV